MVPLLIQGYGTRLQVDGDVPADVASALCDVLPQDLSLESVESQVDTDARFSVFRAEGDVLQVLRDDIVISQVGSSEALFHALRMHVELAIAIFARSGTFVHAGVVGWRGVAVLVPGASCAGKSTLVAELVRHGAVYYSDEYAIVDGDGRVHPYARPITLRPSGGNLRPPAGTTPLEPALVVATTYRPHSKWAPRILTGARAVLPILDNVVVVQDRPALCLQLAARLAPRLLTLQGARPEAIEVAPVILEFVDRLLDGEALPGPANWRAHLERLSVQADPQRRRCVDVPPAERAHRGICFVAIARDEAPIIERCLGSIRDFVDRIVIMDTGSVDGTPAVVERWLSANDMPGEVIHEPWVNFGHNKSVLMARAHEGLAAGCAFIVWCDCDEVLVNDAGGPLTPADKVRFLDLADQHPEVGIFHFETRYGQLRYWRWQAVRNDRLYRWVGAVHEMLVPVSDTGSAHVDFLFNHARKEGNGARNPSRIYEDVAMLEADLEHQPGEPRTTFYLAQSYEDAGQLDEAREMYAARVAITSGFAEERFIALLRLARLARRASEPGRAIEHLAKAVGEFPHRLEGWFELMMALDAVGLPREAWSVGERAPWRSAPPVQALFAEEDVRRWRHRFHLGVLGWYAGRNALGYRLLRDVGTQVPPELQDLLRSNLNSFEGRLHAGPRCVFAGEAAPDLVVLDDFLDDPHAARRFALAQPFDIAGNYPGRRTRAFADEMHKEAFERLLGRRIIFWPTDPGSYNGSYQYTTADMNSWHHRDSTTHGAVLYLTPNAPPESGTQFFVHRDLGVERETPETADRLNADSNDPAVWVLTDQTANRFNRLVVFNGRRTHRSGPYFGTGPSDGRLFQVFFFNVEPA
jgi:hypothetical protein